MQAMLRSAKAELAGIISQKTGLSEERVYSLFEIPPKPELGDLAFPCFDLAKTQKSSPAKIAQELAKELDLTKTLFSRAEPKGPYLNFFLNLSGFAEKVLSKIFQDKNRYGSSEDGAGKTILIDYSSPNIAKPFHIGHLRSTIIGESLARIYEFLGFKVIRVNHLGDWGTQFGMVLSAWMKNKNEEALKKTPIQYLLQLYINYNKQASEKPELQDEAREWFKKLEANDAEAFALWQRFRDLSLQEFKRVYQRLGITFDYYWGESFYNDKMDAPLAMLRQLGLMELGEDNVEMVRVAEDLPPVLLKKSDGATLYATRDLAAAIYRFEKFQPEEMLYVVGKPQELHFRQLFLLLKKMGYPWSHRLKHIKFGHIQGLSTRKGEMVFLEDVLDEAKERANAKIEENIKAGKLNPDVDRDQLAEIIGISALVINDFKNRRERDMNFEWEKILNFDGETGPYLQYTHARINGILRKAEKTPDPKVDFNLLNEQETRELIKKLSLFPEIVQLARKEYEPFIICNYLFELTSIFNQFYNLHRVLGSGEKQDPRLLLVDSVRQILGQGLTLLGLKPLERM